MRDAAQLRSCSLQSIQQQQLSSLLPYQRQQAARGGGIRIGADRPPTPPAAAAPPPTIDYLMAEQDALKVCDPDTRRPFDSVEDAIQRLLPYHVLSDYEAEEDDRYLEIDSTGKSRFQQWEDNVSAKADDFYAAFQKQILAFNILSRKQAEGEFRSEERLMIEKALLEQEKKAMQEMKVEIANRENAGREAAEAKMRMAIAQAEHARAMAQANREMIIRPSTMASSSASQVHQGPSYTSGLEQQNNIEVFRLWRNALRDDEVPTAFFLNDENEPETGETSTKGAMRGAGPFDLNSK